MEAKLPERTSACGLMFLSFRDSAWPSLKRTFPTLPRWRIGSMPSLALPEVAAFGFIHASGNQRLEPHIETPPGRGFLSPLTRLSAGRTIWVRLNIIALVNL